VHAILNSLKGFFSFIGDQAPVSSFLAILFFVAVSGIFCFFILLSNDLFRRRREMRRARRGEEDLPMRKDVASIDLTGTGEQPRSGPVTGWFNKMVIEAGTELTPQEGFLLTVLAGILTGGLAFLLHDTVVTATFGFMVGAGMLTLVFHICRRRRRNAVQKQLPELVDFLSRSVMAGESLDQAIAAAGTTIAEPLGSEMRNCSRQLMLGLSLDVALQGFVCRSPILEARMFSTSLLVQRHSGGDLAVLLQQMARVFRDRLSYRRQFAAATAASRLSVLVISLAAFSAVLYSTIFKPEVWEAAFDLYMTRYFVGIAIVAQIAGYALVAMILRNNY